MAWQQLLINEIPSEILNLFLGDSVAKDIHTKYKNTNVRLTLKKLQQPLATVQSSKARQRARHSRQPWTLVYILSEKLQAPSFTHIIHSN